MNYIISKPYKIGCYVQPGAYQSIASVQKSVGADAIFNFQMYDFSSGQACYVLKVNGKVIGDDGTNYYGYGWNNDDSTLTFTNAAMMSRFDNFAGCVLVAQDGKAISKPSYPSAIGGTRGRMCVGLKQSGDIVVYCWPDGSAGACTMEHLGAKMVALGCVNAVAFDGGGSCQCRTPAGNVSSSRLVQNFLYFMLDEPRKVDDPNGCPYAEPVANVKNGSSGNDVAWMQWYLNWHGEKLLVDGVLGAKTLAALRAFQRAHGLAVDGICGPSTRAALKKADAQAPANTDVACPYAEPAGTVRLGNKGDSVRWLQWYLRFHGYDIVLDGDFGNATLNALKTFQKSAALTADGICGDMTKNALRGAKASTQSAKQAQKQRDAMIAFAEKQVGGMYVYGSQGQADAATIDWSRKCFPNYTTAERAARMKKYLKKHPNSRMFDCSGLVWAAIEDAGVEVVSTKHVTDSTAADLYNLYCVHISKGELKPGDLVFSAALDHVAMVVSGNRIVEAAGSDVGVVLNDNVDVRKVKSIYGPDYGAQEYYTKNPWTKFGRFKCFVEAGL